jgi:hypothetical protein
MVKDEDRRYLDLRWMDLIDDDMQLVAYNAIINNMVIDFAWNYLFSMPMGLHTFSKIFNM